MISKRTLLTSLAALVPAGIAEGGGPCCCRGGSAMVAGTGMPSLTTAAGLVAQLQLSQAVLQLQSTQAVLLQQLASQIHTMAAQSDADVRAGLTSGHADTRFAAAYCVGEKGLPYADELIRLVSDRDPLVRQAARRSLVLLSYQIDAAKKAARKGAKAKAVDFGPAPSATSNGCTASARKWKTWMDQNKEFMEARLTATDAPK